LGQGPGRTSQNELHLIPVSPSLGQWKDGQLLNLAASFSGRLMVGSTLVGVLSALLLGVFYWLVLRRRSLRSRA
jgi:hypothetical protein